MPNAVTRFSEGGGSDALYWANGTAEYEPARPNQPFLHYGQADGTIFTSTVLFGTDTTPRWILCKPGSSGTTSPNQTASPVGIAGQNFGWNVSSEYLDAYAVLEEVSGSYKGRVHQTKPSVIASPRGAVFGNAFDFTQAGWSGFNNNDAPGVNFGTGLGPIANAPFSIDVSFRRDRTNVTEIVCGWDDNNAANGRIQFVLLGDGTSKVEFYNNSGANINIVSGAVAAGSHTARVAYDGATMFLYIDGTLVGSGTASTLRAIAASVEFWVARRHADIDLSVLDGAVDEVRISNIARSTGASYTVDSAPFSVDANTKLLCSFEELRTVRRVLKAGTAFTASMYFEVGVSDTAVQYAMAVNLYKRSASGALTYIAGDDSPLVSGWGALSGPNFATMTVPSDVIFESGDTIQVELWVHGRGGGLTGLLSQTVTVTYGDPTGAPTDRGSDASFFMDASTPANMGFRYLWDETPAGAINAASLTGSLQRRYVKYFTAAIIATAPAGALTRLPLKTLGGSAGPSGAVGRRLSKFFTGSAGTPDGSMTRTPTKALIGSLGAPTGLLVRLVRKILAANVTPAGALRRSALQFLSGTATWSGTVRRTPNKYLIASLGSPVGELIRRPYKLLLGTITPGPGVLRWFVYRFFTGTVLPTGAVIRQPSRFFTGSAGTPAGALRKVPNKPLTGSLSPGPGTIAREMVKRFTGTLDAGGALLRTPTRLFTGVVVPTAESIRFTLVKNLRGFLYGVGKTADWPLNEPVKAITDTVLNHENGTPYGGGARVVLHRDADDEPVAETTSDGSGQFTFPRGTDDPYEYHYKTHYEIAGVKYQGVSEKGQVPT